MIPHFQTIINTHLVYFICQFIIAVGIYLMTGLILRQDKSSTDDEKSVQQLIVDICFILWCIPMYGMIILTLYVIVTTILKYRGKL